MAAPATAIMLSAARGAGPGSRGGTPGAQPRIACSGVQGARTIAILVSPIRCLTRCRFPKLSARGSAQGRAVEWSRCNSSGVNENQQLAYHRQVILRTQ